jgi:acetamidase/formamidase
MKASTHVNWVALVALFGAALGTAGRAAAQATAHELKLTPENVTYGGINGNTEPVLRVASGDTVAVETEGYRVLDYLKFGGVPDSEIPDSLKEVEAYGAAHGLSNPTTGPIYVEGAEPGDILEVHFLKFDFLQPYGWTQISAGSGTLQKEFPIFKVKILHYDVPAGTVEFTPGIVLKLAPFWGTVTVAPPLRPGGGGQVMSPGPTGGNMDDRDLGAGSTLYLPVQVPGALLSFTDSHALQGDGEISISASETSLRGTIQVFVRKRKTILWPRAETPTTYMTMGLDPDLNEASRQAVREMVDFLTTEKGMTREDAYMLCSLAVDLRVTEFVDNPKGVRAIVSKSIFAKSDPMFGK